MKYTDEEIINDLTKILDLLGTCNYLNSTQVTLSHRKVIKAHDALFEMRKKLAKRVKKDVLEI